MELRKYVFKRSQEHYAAAKMLTQTQSAWKEAQCAELEINGPAF